MIPKSGYSHVLAGLERHINVEVATMEKEASGPADLETEGVVSHRDLWKKPGLEPSLDSLRCVVGGAGPTGLDPAPEQSP